MDDDESIKISTLSCSQAKAIVCDSPWGIAIIDTEGRFAWANNAYCSILGCNNSSSLVIGTHFRDWTHPDDIEEDERLAGEVKSGVIPGYVYKKRYVMRGPAGRFRWGILSVTGLWHKQMFTGYQVQFQPLDETPERSLDWSRIREAYVWSMKNKATIAMAATTAAAVISALTAGNLQGLLDLLQQQQDITPAP